MGEVVLRTGTSHILVVYFVVSDVIISFHKESEWKLGKIVNELWQTPKANSYEFSAG
jgi:hypothetical protein